MPQKIKNVKKGVAVKISGENAVKVIKVIEKTHRTFASEVNVAVERHTNACLLDKESNTVKILN